MTRVAVSMMAALGVAASIALAAPPGGGPSGSQGASSDQGMRPQVVVATPGYTNPRDAVGADVLLSSVSFADGVTVGPSHFVYAGSILHLHYAGPTGALRVQNGPLATVGNPGVSYIEAQDLQASSVSSLDCLYFCQKVDQTFENPNLNNRIDLKGANGLEFSITIALESRIFDSHLELDNRPELFIFEEQGNSVMTVQALNDLLLPVGTPVEVRAVDLASIQPSKVWVGRIATDGAVLSGAHELMLKAIDLTSLGVPNVKYLRITNRLSGGGQTATDFKVIGVDTSPAYAPPTMGFD